MIADSAQTSRSGRTAPRASGRRMRPSGRRPAWVKWAVAVGTPLGLVALWWVTSARSTSVFFPPLQEILVRFRELWLFDRFGSDVVPSLSNLAVGYLLAAAIGITLGIVLALVRPLRWTLEPVIHFIRSIPPVALVPVLITLIGFGDEMRIATIVSAAVFPTLIATMDGIRAVDGTLLDVGALYRLRRRERMMQIYLPAASPQIFAGLQVSLQVAFIVMIASEMLGASAGIGAMTLLAQQSFMTTDMWAGVLLLGALGFIINKIFDLIKRRILAWYIGSKEANRDA